MKEEKPKNYYSLNLTEGRIFIIFISILIIVTVVAFGIALIISNNRKANDINLSLENEENLNLNSEDFSYYNELDEDNNLESFIENKRVEDNAPKNEQISEFQIKEQETKDQKVDSNIDNVKVKNKEVVKIDDSEVVYSSKYIEDNEKSESVEKANNTKKIVINKVNVQTKKDSNAKSRRYIVQIGSYINEKTAEEISLFYQIQGYPAYITEIVKSEKTYYRLRVGPFKEKERAEKYLTSLKQSKYGNSSYISVVYL